MARRTLLVLAALPALAPASAPAAVQITADRVEVRTETARAVVARKPLRLEVQDSQGRSVLRQVPNDRPAPQVEPPTIDPEQNGVDNLPETTLYSPLTFTVGREDVVQFTAGTWVGNLQTATRSGTRYAATDVVEATPDGEGGARLVVATNDPTGRRLAVSVRPFREGIRVTARPTPDDGVAFVGDSFAAARDEAFRGFGGRHNALDQRGTKLESFLAQSGVSPPGDQAVGAAPGTGGETYMFPNGPTTAYFQQSSFVSSGGFGFLGLNDELTRWRMAADRPDAWQVAASAKGLDYVVLPGDAKTAIGRLTAITGRQRAPQPWMLDPQLDRLVKFPSQGAEAYRAEVEQDLRDLERYADVGFKTYRIEAWEYFSREALRDVIRRFNARGVKVLLYFRSFVGKDEIGTDAPRFYDEAVAKGYVATRDDGSPYTFTSNFFADAAQIDFTDPAAVAWWKARVREALDLGADGFMQDFGEQVLLPMRFHDGSTGATMHNRLPVLFHRATREAIDAWKAENPRREEPYFFTRSGFSGTPGSVAYESATWPGDETTDFTRSSGLASQAPDMLNRGIAGAVGFGSDIGGYFDAGRPTTTKELFLRWAAWAALTPIFRVHGAVSAGTHTPWSFDADTVTRFTAMSKLHQRAQPLLLELWRRSTQTGLPIATPFWLAFPDQPKLAGEDQSWMLGDDLLVAPVVRQGVDGRDVALPAGCWQREGTGARIDGGRTVRAAAAPGELPWFTRCGEDPLGDAARRAAAAAPAKRCSVPRGLRSLRVAARRGGRVQVRFRRAVRRPVEIAVLRHTSGRRVLARPVVVARRANARSGVVLRRGRGVASVRARLRLADGRLEVRRRVLGGRPAYVRAPGCGAIRRFALSGPAFGGSTQRALRVSFTTARAGRAVVELRRGARVVVRRAVVTRAGRARRIAFAAARRGRGAYAVRLRVGRAEATLRSLRL